jgi:chromosome segregation protein
VGKLLESAKQTLNYWREQYDRYQQKKQLRMKRRFLERELAWAEASKREKMVSELKKQIQKEQNEILRIESEAKNVENQLSELQGRLDQRKSEWRKLLEERLTLERERAKNESNISLASQTLEETQSWTEARQEQFKECLSEIEQLEMTLSEFQNPTDFKIQLTQIRADFENFENTWVQRLNMRRESMKESIENSNKQLNRLNVQVADAQTKMNHLSLEMENNTNEFVDHKINLALLRYRRETLKKALEKLDKELQTSLEDLHEAVKRAEETGPQLVSMKSVMEILDEIRVTDGHLAALADVSEDIERMYESYSKLYLELEEKARLVAENREKALEEVEIRMEAWRTVLRNLLRHVSLQYQGILSQAQAMGEVRLVDEHDIEVAGLDILVGFKGAKPVSLNAYTQSGGERSTATITFLLALQQHIRSPFRAVDEYDVHMDPKNRELIAKLLVSSVKGLDAQYLAITPSQVTFEEEEDVHIITVQNVEGSSLIKGLV